MARTKPSSNLPRPSSVDFAPDDVPDLIRDRKSHVVVSAGGRDRGPQIKRGPRGGKRLVHDTVERVDIQYEQQKTNVTVTRLVDTLASLYRKESITDAQYIAGKRFQDAFDLGHLEQMPAMRFDGMPSSGKKSSDPDKPQRVIDARTEIFDAMKAMGGWGSPCGIATWWILGMRWSIRQVAQRETVNRIEVWTGTLIGALGVLESHYQDIGYRSARRRQAPGS
jgi:hypothetical protein